MPCYLFTYHAYGSWLPDRKQGYVERKQGILPQDQNLADQYRERMTEAGKVFDSQLQQAIVVVLLDSQEKQHFESYAIATDSTHVHVLLGWRDGRAWLRMRSTVKGSISRSLNQEFGKSQWLSEGGSRKQVRDREHFDYLVSVYMPKHRGWKWDRERGFFE